MKKQATWLRKDLKANQKKWTVALFHRPAYHTEDGRGPELVTYYLAPVLKELGVNLVLAGHDHALAWTYPMKNDQPLKDGSNGKVYLIGGSSGWKFYDAVKKDYLNYLYDDNSPVYSFINIDKERITIEARTIDGEKLQTLNIEKAKAPTPSPSSSKDFSTFSILGKAGVIQSSNKTVDVSVPYGLTSLASNFTATGTGTSVKVGVNAQTSGVTLNNFTYPVTYTVYAEDESYQDYIVTVNTMASPAPTNTPTTGSGSTPTPVPAFLTIPTSAPSATPTASRTLKAIGPQLQSQH